MHRRGFIGFLSALAAAPIVPLGTAHPAPAPSRPALPIARADGKGYVIGVATETVHVGDFVQIQTSGPVTANLSR